MSTRSFSGHESWVFRASHAEQLCGHHADLLSHALCPQETVRCLVYSPLREADRGPFRTEADGISDETSVALDEHAANEFMTAVARCAP